MHIDAHQHFWDPARGDYFWMPPDDPVLTRPYGPADLEPALAKAGVERTVLVQAAPTVAETEYLLAIADKTPHVAKVVGWIDFEDPGQIDTLRRFAEHPKFAGVRPMIQDLPDDDWMLQTDVQWAYEALIELDLTFDCLGFPRHLGNFHTLLTRYPDLRAVIDHCMKPQFRENGWFGRWADGMTRLAEDTHASVKLSGLVTEADTNVTAETLRPVVDHLLHHFSAARIMWGSDWPVSRLRMEYGDWHTMALDLTRHLTHAEQQEIFAETARNFYRIEL